MDEICGFVEGSGRLLDRGRYGFVEKGGGICW